MSKKVTSIEITGFRGIPKSLKLDFWNKSQNKPCSTIIFGDNGTGKSSIVDALEFGLQSRIERERSWTSELKPSVLSLRNQSAATIKVNLQDNSMIERHIEYKPVTNDAPRISLSNAFVYPEYCIAPIVLRRNDILKFIQTPSHQKQLLFFSYIKGLYQEPKIDESEDGLREFPDQRIRIKVLRRELVETLSKMLMIPVEKIPLDPNKFDEFVTENIYKGLSKKSREQMIRNGLQIRVNNKALSIANEIKTCAKELKMLSHKKPNNSTIQVDTQAKLSEIFADAGNYLTESFKAISSANFFERIEMRIGQSTNVSFDIIVHLKNGKAVQPSHVFSEANLDLLALLVFLSIIKEASIRGQEKFLILDDVLQSVDSSIRLMFVDFLLKNFGDWQLVFSIHDRLFLNQLRTIFRRYNHEFVEIEIVKWDFENGPFVIRKDVEIDNSLAVAMSTNDINLITSQAGVMLEKICNHLSYSLPISIIRKKEDKYTLGDLWPGVYKKLKKTKLSDTLDTIERLSFLRNLFGAHYNEWAMSLSNNEALLYANSILTFYESVFCQHCLTWVSVLPSNSWKCACGHCELV